MKKIISLTWLRIERAPDLLFDLAPGVLLAVGGAIVIALGMPR